MAHLYLGWYRKPLYFENFIDELQKKKREKAYTAMI